VRLLDPPKQVSELSINESDKQRIVLLEEKRQQESEEVKN